MAVIKNLGVAFVVLAIMLFSFSIVSAALTVSIKNAVIVLRPNVGDKVDKYVTVENTNDIPITVYLNTSGDLADSIKLKQTQATLAVGEVKNIYYTIDVKKAGSFKSGIDVSLPSPDGKGAGARLSQVVWVITKGTSDNSGTVDTATDLDNTNTTDSNIDPITGNVISGNNNSNVNYLPYILLSLTTLILLAGLIFLIYLARKKKKKNQGSSIPIKSNTKEEKKTKSKKETKMDEV